MNTAQVIAENNLELFIKDIFVLENRDDAKNALLPFFADGYPGIVYCQAANKVFLLPPRKELSAFYLYGQMIKPFELFLQGAYLMVVFQLYPFAPKLLFDVDPQKLNDDCYDLSKIGETTTGTILRDLAAISESDLQIEIIAGFLSKIARKKGMEEYRNVQRAVEIVAGRKGIITVHELARLLDISERTLRRKFDHYIGISPKKFAKIIQFQTSVQQISEGSFSKLTDVVYENGYADQSHFIRNIKKFTGKRPLQLKSLY